MPLFAILRFVFMLASLALFGLAIYLGWAWYEGHLVRIDDVNLVHVRDDWLLWAAIGLVAFSFLGRLLIVPLLARRDTDPSKADRSEGMMVSGESGSTLYVEMHGPVNAPVIVLTHGWAMDSTIWHYAKRDLSKTYRVIVWDLPGLGRSKAKTIGLEAFARDLASVIALAGSQKVLLVGHSIGGMTIQTLARDNPAFYEEHVAGTVLINTTYTNPLKTMILPRLAQAIRWPLLEPIMRIGIVLQPLVWLGAWQSYFSGAAHMANRLGFGKYVTHSQLSHTTLLATRNAPGNINRGNLAMFRWDATGALAGLSPPVLLLAGSFDIVTKPGASQAIASTASGAACVVIEGVNHMGFLEQSTAYNGAIADFAASLGRS